MFVDQGDMAPRRDPAIISKKLADEFNQDISIFVSFLIFLVFIAVAFCIRRCLMLPKFDREGVQVELFANADVGEQADSSRHSSYVEATPTGDRRSAAQYPSDNGQYRPLPLATGHYSTDVLFNNNNNNNLRSRTSVILPPAYPNESSESTSKPPPADIVYKIDPEA